MHIHTSVVRLTSKIIASGALKIPMSSQKRQCIYNETLFGMGLGLRASSAHFYLKMIKGVTVSIPDELYNEILTD